MINVALKILQISIRNPNAKKICEFQSLSFSCFMYFHQFIGKVYINDLIGFRNFLTKTVAADCNKEKMISVTFLILSSV